MKKKIDIFKHIRRKKEEEESLGKWVVPTEWKAITLGQYQEIERLHEKEGDIDIRDILAVLCGKTKDEVYALPMAFLDTMLEMLSFLREAPDMGTPSNSVIIDGERYSINIFEKVKTGEYISADNIIRSDKHNYAAVLAIMCRKDGEVYDSKFEAEVFEDRMRMYENTPVTTLLPLVGFFLALWAGRQMSIQASTQMLQAERFIVPNTGSSGLLGLCRRLSLKWRMRNLRKLNASGRDT